MSKSETGQASVRTLGQRLLSGGAWTAGARVIAGLSGFAVNALLSRLVSPDDLGAYFLLVSVASSGALVAQLGLHIGVVRMVAEALAQESTGRARGVVRVAIALVAVCALLLALGLAVFGREGAIAVFGSAQLSQAAWLAAVWLMGLALMNLVAEIFRGLQDFRIAGMLGGAASNLLFLAALLGVMVMQGSATLPVAAALGAGSVAAMALSGLVLLEQRMRRLGEVVVVSPREVLAVGLPLLVTSMAILITSQADLWILGMYRDKNEVAVYGAAVRLVQLVMMPMLMLNAVLAPVISELFSKGRKTQLERVMRTSAALTGLPAIAAFVLLSVTAASILGAVYGDFYRSGSTALLLVSAGQAVNVLCGPAAVMLMMCGQQRAVMTISVAAGIGLVGGSLAVVGSLGFNGVAAVVGVTTALHGIACWIQVRRSTGVWTHFGFGNLAEMVGELKRVLHQSRR